MLTKVNWTVKPDQIIEDMWRDIWQGANIAPSVDRHISKEF